MIATMRPGMWCSSCAICYSPSHACADIDHADEYIRNTTSRAFAVVASALGIPAMLPFLKAVCLSKKSWEARHTGIKIIQQIAILVGCAVLPHLKNLVDIIRHGLEVSQHRSCTLISHCLLCRMSNPKSAQSLPWLLPHWLRLLTHTVSSVSIKFFAHCGRELVSTVVRVLLRS